MIFFSNLLVNIYFLSHRHSLMLQFNRIHIASTPTVHSAQWTYKFIIILLDRLLIRLLATILLSFNLLRVKWFVMLSRVPVLLLSAVHTKHFLPFFSPYAVLLLLLLLWLLQAQLDETLRIRFFVYISSCNHSSVVDFICFSTFFLCFVSFWSASSHFIELLLPFQFSGIIPMMFYVPAFVNWREFYRDLWHM